MVLSTQQLEAAKRGEPIRIEEDETQFVILRADLYEAYRARAAGELSTEEMRLVAAATFEDADCAEPIRP